MQRDLLAMCEAFYTARCGWFRDRHAGSVAFDECVAQGMGECWGSLLRSFAGSLREGRILYDRAAPRSTAA